MRLAIVIPTLDEARVLPAVLAAALELADEVCVSDGGSRDGTPELARGLGARVVVGPPGRGVQLNRGARATSAEILLFLHADTRLPATAALRVREAVAAGAVGGGFGIVYDESHPAQDLANRLVARRTRWTGCPLGDQAQFATRAAFEAVGGFRDWPILEDVDFIRRLRRHGRTVVVADPVVSSGRRVRELGVAKSIAVNWLIWGLYFVGVPPRRLARLYRDIR